MSLFRCIEASASRTKVSGGDGTGSVGLFPLTQTSAARTLAGGDDGKAHSFACRARLATTGSSVPGSPVPPRKGV